MAKEKTEVHKHDFNDLSPTLDGMICKQCRCKWTMPDGFPSFLLALQQTIDDMQEHIEKQSEALLTLGLVPCEDCGGWFKPGTDGGFDDKVTSVCVRCLPQWYETNYMGATNGDVERMDSSIARWFTTHETAIKKGDVRTHYWVKQMFADELGKLRAVS